MVQSAIILTEQKENIIAQYVVLPRDFIWKYKKYTLLQFHNCMSSGINWLIRYDFQFLSAFYLCNMPTHLHFAMYFSM